MNGQAQLVYFGAAQSGIGRADSFLQARQWASTRYGGVYRAGHIQRLLAFFTGSSNHLLALDQVAKESQVKDRRSLGIRVVSIDQIKGSEGRHQDFDNEFRPLERYNRDRWLDVAAAIHMGKSLPPVDLIQVGHTFYVRDGHHRISVAKALGQLSIEATIAVWDV